LTDARVFFARNTIVAAKTYLPFGSGLGTFVPVYQMFEKPDDLMPYAFANRAHNDFLESWLETGVFGPILVGLFSLWFVIAAARVWRPAHGTDKGINLGLAQAGSIVIVLLIAHSTVDYPLRSGALMAVFAFACALLIPPPQVQETATTAAPKPG
jgi:O-antigen ligase